MSRVIRLTDRTRTTTDWTCGRERFYLTEYGGRGIVRASGKVELDFGTDIHAVLEELARRIGPTDVVGDVAPRVRQKVYDREVIRAGEDGAEELAAIAEGAFRGFAACVWPQILQFYDIVAIEVECTKPLTDWLTFMARPDLIVRSKATGELWYIEYKTTSQRPEDWVNQWNKAVQVHSGCYAAEETLGEPVVGCILIGLYKGYQKEGHYRSVWTEGWRNLSSIPIAYSHTYVRNKGWERFAPSTLDGGLGEWIAAMPPDLLAKQFPKTLPIYARRDLCDRFFAQLVKREGRIKEAIELIQAAAANIHDPELDKDLVLSIEDIMDDVFGQDFSQCTGRYGRYDCPMIEACWNPRVGADPLGSGLFVERDPHHEAERAQFGLEPRP